MYAYNLIFNSMLRSSLPPDEDHSELLEMLERFRVLRWGYSPENPSNYPEFDREWDHSLSLTNLEVLCDSIPVE
jgi:hypothetical protein